MTLLFPSPQELVKYINNWVQYVEQLEADIVTRDQRLAQVNAERDETVSKVADELADLRTKTSLRIRELELSNANLAGSQADISAQMTSLMERLCVLLEIKHTPRTTVQEVLLLAEQLITESKRVIRANL
jgi:hypothetical protein